MNIKKVLDHSFGLITGSNNQWHLRDKMGVLGAAYVYMSITIFTVSSLTLCCLWYETYDL